MKFIMFGILFLVAAPAFAAPTATKADPMVETTKLVEPKEAGDKTLFLRVKGTYLRTAKLFSHKS